MGCSFPSCKCVGQCGGIETASWIFRRKLAKGQPCPYCAQVMGGKVTNALYPTVDHIVPRSQGGLTEQRNIAIVCRRCNEDKDDMGLEQWVRLLRMRGDKRAEIVASFVEQWARHLAHTI